MNNNILTHKSLSRTLYQLLVRTVPAVGTHSTSYWYAQYQLSVRFLVLALFLLLLAPLTVWGQTITDGLYYIASGGNNGTNNQIVYNSERPTTNYYLCPTENWYYYQSDSPYYLQHTDTPSSNDNGMPFMTTYQCLNDNNYDSNKALWCIKKKGDTDYYYIIHVADGKYLTRNGKIGHSSNAGRMRIHLESSPADDDALFTITYVEQSDCYDIKTKKSDGSSGNDALRQYLNVSGGSQNTLQANNKKTDGPKVNGNGSQINVGGIIGLWTYGAYYEPDQSKNDQNSRWCPKSTTLSAPSISKVSANNTITITDNNNISNCTIRYTIGDGSQDAPTATIGEEYDPLYPPVITDETNVKAAVFAYGVRVSSISNAMLNQTITLSDESFVYNGSERKPTVTVKYGDETIPAEEYDVDYSDNTAAGTATVTVSNKANKVSGNFYVITDSKGFEITKAPLTVTAVTKSKTYGDADPELTYTSSGLVGTDALTGSMDREVGESVGTYAISQGTLSAGDNYTISFTGANLTISPKPLTITANDKTITYGDAPANDGVTYGEFAGTETSAVLTGTLAYAYNYAQYGDAGSYTITPSGLSNSNYDISFVPGTLTVNKKEVTVTSGITASDKTYDGTTDATLDGSTAVIDGKINNDDLTVLAGSGTFADKNVGTDKTVTINSFTFGGAKAGNYQMAASGHQATAQASITPAALTVTAEAQSKTYGDDDPEFTYSSDGLISPDAISGVLSRAAGENVGSYAISQGTLTAGSNYNITFTSANLTISPKSLGDGNQPAEGIDIELTAEGNLNAVKDGSTTLEEDVDYTYTIETEGSDQLVTVTGIGNYTSSAKALYAKPVFTKPTGSNNAAAVYKASKDLANPSGITPYIVRKVNPSIGTITITPLQYIPEGVPVLLLSDEEASGFVASPKEEATPEITDGTRNSNKLLVSEGGETVEAAQIYMFYKGEFVLTKAGTLGTGKYYLYNPNYSATSTPTAQSQSALQFVIEEEETTGINDIRSKMADVRGDYYTLDGRKLSGKPTKAGLYIMNGRKTIIK